jgi:hypothetical protein
VPRQLQRVAAVVLSGSSAHQQQRLPSAGQGSARCGPWWGHHMGGWVQSHDRGLSLQFEYPATLYTEGAVRCDVRQLVVMRMLSCGDAWRCASCAQFVERVCGSGVSCTAVGCRRDRLIQVTLITHMLRQYFMHLGVSIDQKQVAVVTEEVWARCFSSWERKSHSCAPWFLCVVLWCVP